MVRPYSTSKHTSPYEVIIDSGTGSHSELVRSTSIAKAARKAAALHRMTLGPIVITADGPHDRTGYRVTFHSGMFGGDKESIMYVSLAAVR